MDQDRSFLKQMLAFHERLTHSSESVRNICCEELIVMECLRVGLFGRKPTVSCRGPRVEAQLLHFLDDLLLHFFMHSERTADLSGVRAVYLITSTGDLGEMVS